MLNCISDERLLLLTSLWAADAGRAARGGQDGHGFRVAELQSVSFLHSVVTCQQGEFHQLSHPCQQRLCRHQPEAQ